MKLLIHDDTALFLGHGSRADDAYSAGSGNENFATTMTGRLLLDKPVTVKPPPPLASQCSGRGAGGDQWGVHV